MIAEILKFIVYSSLIVLISKFLLVRILRNLAENLNLRANIVGNIAGIATSIPEFLTVTISSFTGLMNASIFNILSSNVINFFQYIFSITFNRNFKKIMNKAIIIDIILVLITIVIPMILVNTDIDNVVLIPIFILLAVVFIVVNNIAHKKYLKNVDNKILEKEIAVEKEEKRSNRKTYVYIILLIISGILLYFVGNRLSDTLENLARYFNISEMIIGIALGFITSIPELITFFESQKHYKKTEEDAVLGVVEATNNLFISNILNLFIIQSIGIFVYNLFVLNWCYIDKSILFSILYIWTFRFTLQNLF
mgnify:FL=1